ncbi:MAG TPA: AAA family ATPase [Gaiellales bacterium]|nr:AAA family ATPase [Gaiellales bacterium]
MNGIPEHPPHPELIRVALMSDHPGLRELFERSGMVRVVDTVPDVLVWMLPHDADGLLSDVLAALADPAAPGVVVLSDRHPIRWFQEALRLGVDDVLCLPQTPQSLGMAAAKARAARARRMPVAAEGPAGGGHVFTVFSTKGGSGRTVIASNLAVCFAQAGLRTLLLDLDLHSGDCALVLGLAPRATMLDLVAGSGPIDAEALGRAVTRHVSGADVLAAPARPEEEELVSVERLAQLVETAREGYDAVVIDAAAAFSPTTLLALDHTDTLLLVGAPDVPAVRSVRIALETLELLELDLPDVRIVMNRAGADVGLDTAEIEAALRREIAYALPSDRAVPLSVNRGRAVVADDPRSKAARSLLSVSRSLVATVGR